MDLSAPPAAPAQSESARDARFVSQFQLRPPAAQAVRTPHWDAASQSLVASSPRMRAREVGRCTQRPANEGLGRAAASPRVRVCDPPGRAFRWPAPGVALPTPITQMEMMMGSLGGQPDVSLGPAVFPTAETAGATGGGHPPVVSSTEEGGAARTRSPSPSTGSSDGSVLAVEL